MKEVTICPNCKGNEIISIWVPNYKDKIEIIKEISIEDYALNEIENKKKENYSRYYFSGSISFTDIYPSSDSILKNFIQLVLRCKNCGYTKIIDIESYIVAEKVAENL